MKKNVITAIVLCFVVFTTSAQVRKYSNEFLNIGVGGRGLGMSNAQTASTEDVYAGYYNPAGLANISNTFQVGLMHSEYFAGIAKYDYGSVAVPIDDKKRVLGFSFFRFGVDDIPNTLFLVGPDGTVDYSKITSFSAADYAFMLHYAQKFKIPGLTAGGTVKVIYRTLGPFGSATGFGIDAGLQYRNKGWRVGLMLKDITNTFNAWSFKLTDAQKQVFVSTGNDLPKNTLEYTAPTIMLGGAYDWAVDKKKNFHILPEVNFVFTTDGKRNVLVPGKPISMDLNVGLELNYMKIGYIRAGVGNIQRYYAESGKQNYSVSPSVGAGIRIKVIAIDYTLTNLTALKGSSRDNGLYSHVVSLRLDINVKSKKQDSKN
jgi:hypothetical protein